MSRRGIFGRYAIVLGILLAGWLLWRSGGPQTVTVVTPIRGPAVQAVYATGTVEAGVTVRIAPQVAGRIIELPGDEGKLVKTGDMLARFDDTDLRASLAELEARARYAEQQLERVQALVKRGWATADRLDQARAEGEAARHAAQRIRSQLGFLTLHAPADGQIIRRDGEVGDYIPVNQPIFYMAKTGEAPRITADVDEEDVPLVKTGQKALIRADAFPDKVFEGTVTEITPKGDPVARSYRVRIALPEDSPLLIGMTAETNIITRENKDALLIPSTALPSGSDLGGAARSANNTVWVVRDSRAVRQTVQLGIRGREQTEVTSGLVEGDQVVINPPKELAPQERVRVKLAEPPQQPAPPGAKTEAGQ
jgi:RND family efflux transporter MFP subunit